MTEIVTVEKIENLDTDIEKAGQATNEDTIVKPRYGNEFKSFPMISREAQENLTNAVYQVIETGGFEPFSTEVELLASTPILEKKAAKALDTKKVWLWDGKWNDTGLSELDLAKEYTNELINPNPSDIIRDKHGFVIAELAGNLFSFFTHFKAQSIKTNEFSAEDNDTSELTIQDGFGFHGNLSDFIKQEVELEPRSDVDVKQPLFTQKLAFWSSQPFKLNVPCLLKNRAEQTRNKHVLASIASTQTEFESTSDQDIQFSQFANLGTEAVLVLRDKQNAVNRSRLVIKCIQVADSTANQNIKVHAIGDSISNRGGLYYTQQYLNKHGYTATFIGTMLASNASDSATSNGTYLGECREGWETGDFTYQVTNRVNIVNAGDETTYQAYDKSTKWTHNPYLRLATEGDDPSVVRNGYVFDFQYYLTRFALDTPEVVTIGLGTNDIRDLDEPTLDTEFYNNMKLMINQIMKVSSSIKIVLFIPGTSFEETRNSIWTNEYVPVIQQLQKLANEFTNIILLPAWTINSQEVAYSFIADSTDNISGAGYGAFSDSIHPIQSSRFQIFNYLAANIVAAKSI